MLSLNVTGTQLPTVIFTSDDELQTPLLIVHLKTKVPRPSPSMVVTGDDGLLIVCVPGPLNFVQRPVPTVGVFPAIVMVMVVAGVTGPQCV